LIVVAVAFEAFCANQKPKMPAALTVGSPLKKTAVMAPVDLTP
jgi:hypothetical protein